MYCTYLWGFTAIPSPLMARSPLHCPALPCPALPAPAHSISSHHWPSLERSYHATLHVFHTCRVAPSIQLPRFCQSQTQYSKGVDFFFLIRGERGGTDKVLTGGLLFYFIFYWILLFYYLPDLQGGQPRSHWTVSGKRDGRPRGWTRANDLVNQ